MKNSYKVVALSFLLFGTTFLSAQGVEKILVKSFNLQGNKVVSLKLDGNVEVQEWNNPIMRVQMNISLPTGSNAMLKSLIQAGRYNLKSKTTDENYLVYAPSMQKEVTIRGEKLQEQLSFVVYAPADVIIKLEDTTTAAKETIDKVF